MGRTEFRGIAWRGESECHRVEIVPSGSGVTVFPLFLDHRPFLLPYALWVNLVGEADQVRNVDGMPET